MRKLKTLEQLKTCMVNKHNLDEIFGLLFPFGKDTDDSGYLPDFTNKKYTTHHPTVMPDGNVNLTIKKNIKEEEGDEQEDVKKYEDEVEDTTPPEIEEPEDPTNVQPQPDTYPQTDYMGGMMEPEEEKDPTELGRIYELKKIYSRLTAIEGYLGDESSKELLQIRSYVSQAIELFEVVSSNFNSYKDKLPEIIVMYYKFLKEVYHQVKEIYRKQSNLGD
jgi:hypothetical protein